MAIPRPTMMSGQPDPDHATNCRRSQNGNVRDQVVSRAQPRRAKVDVICAVAPEKNEAQRIGGERERAHSDHGRNFREGSGAKLEGDLEEDPDAKQGHDRTFEQCRASLPAQASMNNEEAESVDKRVAEHVEGVREKCAGTRNEAGPKLDNEHESVDREDGPKHSAVTGPDRVELVCFGFAAIIHEIDGFAPTGAG